MPPDRRRDLEDELRDLGPRVEYPPTPDLSRSVRSSLEAGEGTTGSPARSGPPLWWVAAAALIVIVALPLFALAANVVGGGLSGGAGGMAGGAAGGGGQAGGAAGSGGRAAGGPEAGDEPTVSSRQGAQAGSAAAGAASVASGGAATAFPAQGGAEVGSAGWGTPGESLGLGERIPLREARERSEAPILFPRSPEPGRPDEAYDRGIGPGFIVLYRAGSGLPDMRAAGVGRTGIGLLLTQTRGDVGRAYLAGGTARGEGLETASVNGGQGYWVPPGERRLEIARDLGPGTGVLIWERDGQALRIEADVTKEEAVRIAESVR